ncbi:MAG TPA: glycoside hydrolase family 3 N-terminal domain-containing protein, partial [Pseudobdellovibrionaceae bacterium]|nr:glycoside hydrolase family 3 N-terminal domain-containing protein [Pseudobdellovibrionaceae bacterium]
MSLREKVGQLFLVGFPQNHLDANLKDFIATQKPGGFILFRRNLKDSRHIRRFTADLSRTARIREIAPFLAVDQEGGSVTRVPFFPSLPSALSVGLAGREDLARDLGEESGRLLRWHGFNLNLAPVLDLSDPKSESFIGSRSFGSDPILSGKLGRSYAEGLRDAGVIPTGKHFPGLGGTRIDLHLQAAGFQSTLIDFKNRDLKPFELFAKMGPFSALMISQMSYPFLDPSGIPAPFSKPILRDLLRKELGFEGLVVTDDL